jgi:hypothetical protein
VADLALSSFLAQPLALLGLALAVPIILLYLLRPKPKLVLFPSTMFIRLMEKNKRFMSFLQRLVQDPLLLAQVFIITVLVVALAAPFYNSKQELREEESIAIILDASASMQSRDGDPTRFDAAVSKAGELIAGFNQNDEVTVIAAENVPAVALSKAPPEQAAGVLPKLRASDTPTNVGDAMMLARDILSSSDRKKVIYVLSDFAGGGGLDPQIARKIALVSGMEVELLRVGVRGDNAGIVGLEAHRMSTDPNQLYLAASVRNYYPAERTLRLRVLSGGAEIASAEKAVEAGGEGFFYLRPNVSSYGQVIKVELAEGDDLPADDAAWADIPAVRLEKVLLLKSEGPSDKFLVYMLQSLRNLEQVAIAVPPVTPDVNAYDIIVLGNVPAQNLLPGMFRDIKNRVAKGASLVVIASDGLQRIGDPDLWSIMPVDIVNLGSRETAVKVTEEHEMLTDVVFDNVMLKKYYTVRERDNETNVLVGAEAYQNPLIAYRRYGDGYVVYIGINSDPDWSNLYYSSSFPIFWSQMIKYLTLKQGASSAVNLRTGDYMSLPEPLPVQMPSGETVASSNVYLDKAGVYRITYPGRVQEVAVSLLDSVESNITGSDTGASDAAGYTVKLQELDVKVEMFRQILALMLALLLVELALYRRRGLL